MAQPFRTLLFCLSFLSFANAALATCDELFQLLDDRDIDAFVRHVASVEDLNNCQKNTNSILRQAVIDGQMRAVEALVAAKADILEDAWSGSLMHAAAKNGRATLMQYLRDAGVPTDTPDISGNTPLVLASLDGRVDAVRLLVGWGASLQPATTYNQPFWCAVANKHAAVAALLLRAGFELDPQNQKGSFFLAHAPNDNSLLQKLQELTQSEDFDVEVQNFESQKSIATSDAIDIEVCRFRSFVHLAQKTCCTPLFETLRDNGTLVLNIHHSQYIDDRVAWIQPHDFERKNFIDNVCYHLGLLTVAEMVEAPGSFDNDGNWCWSMKRDISEAQSQDIRKYFEETKNRLQGWSTLHGRIIGFDSTQFAAGAHSAAGLDDQSAAELSSAISEKSPWCESNSWCSGAKTIASALLRLFSQS